MRIQERLKLLPMWIRQAKPKPHQAHFNTAVPYFTYAFTLNSKMDIDVAAARLLKSGLAETAIAPSEGEIRVSEKFRDLEKVQKQAKALKDLNQILGGDSKKKIFAWGYRNPRMFLAMCVGLIANRFRSTASSQPGPTGSGEIIDEALDLIDTSMSDMQSVVAALAIQDRAIYDPQYLTGTPFIRLQLRSFNFTIDQKQLDVGKRPFTEEALVTLLLHRSGVALLMIAVPLLGRFTSEDLLKIGLGGSPSFSDVTLCEEVLDLSAKRHGRNAEDYPGEWQLGVSHATRWKRLVRNSSVSAEDVFNLYALAARQVLSATKEDSGFLCFNSLFIEELSCCREKDAWLGMHSVELASLVGRFVPSEDANEAIGHSLPGKDWSYSQKTSIYLNTGNALRIKWSWADRGHEDTIDHFWLLSIIDNFLLQYWQMEQLQIGLDLSEGIHAISRAQARIAIGLSEYRDSQISYVNAREMAAYLAASNDLDRSYQFALDRIEVLHTMIESRRAVKAVRRDTLLTGLGSLAAVCFALPAINQSLVLAVKLKKTTINPLGGYKGNVDELSWQLYAIFLFILLIAILISVARRSMRVIRRPRMSRAIRPFGVAWPPSGATVLDEDVSHD